MKLTVGVLGWVVVLLFVACAPAPAAVEPTVAPLPQPEVTAEQMDAPGTAPTETPLQRPTLPPTWTPTPESTAEPTVATATLDFVANANTGADVRLGNCLQFGPDLARNPTFVVVGDPVTVYWTPAGGGVFYYEVVLRDANGNIVDSSRRVPASRQYTFSGNLFDFNSVYTWSITPYDSSADPICDSRTSEMRATLR